MPGIGPVGNAWNNLFSIIFNTVNVVFKMNKGNKERLNILLVALSTFIIFFVGIINFSHSLKYWDSSKKSLAITLILVLSVMCYTCLESYYLTRKKSFYDNWGKIRNFKTFLIDNILILMVSVVGSVAVIGFVDALLKIRGIFKFGVSLISKVISSIKGILFELTLLLVKHPWLIGLISIIGAYLLLKWTLYKIFIEGKGEVWEDVYYQKGRSRPKRTK